MKYISLAVHITMVFAVVNSAAVTVSPSQMTFDCGQPAALVLEAQSAELVSAPAAGRIRVSEPVFVKPANKVLKGDKIASDIANTGLSEVMITLDLAKGGGKAKSLMGRIDYAQGQMVGRISDLRSDVLYVCENIPVINAKINSQTFEYLKSSELAACVEAVIEVEMHTAQGIPLIGADVYRSIYDGGGVAVAILDSGVDYTHPALGGGGFPNAKVIGGYDFGNGDTNPMPSMVGHGTQCAGVAAGDIVSYADYTGGVAPGSRLYALKIMPDSSASATSANITSAIDWCISHQFDDPNNPILVISMSVGGGGYTGTCDDLSTALTNAVNAATASGITVLASSGNEGLCSAISFPACISNVISVGAVFDNNIGTAGFCLSADSCIGSTSTSCASPKKYYSTPTSAGMVAQYSNSSSLVDVLAPANNAYTTDIKGVTGSSVGDYYGAFGGTSAACAYSAGAVASLQSAAAEIIGRFLTPSEVRGVLKSEGEPVDDWKISITTPRIDLAASIERIDVYNGRQFTVENGVFTATITGITTPPWISVFPQPPVRLGSYETAVFYTEADCQSCNYENLSGTIALTGSVFPSGFTANIAVDMPCPECTLSANLNAGCEVDLADLTILADCWLSTAQNCSIADIAATGQVTLQDFAIMATQWLMSQI